MRNLLADIESLKSDLAARLAGPDSHRVFAGTAALLHSNDLAVLNDHLRIRIIDLEHGIIATAGDGHAVQIDGQRLADHVADLRRIDVSQQLHGIAVLGSRNGLRQRSIRHTVDLGNVNACLDAVGTVTVGGRNKARRAQALGHRAGERTAGNGDRLVGSELSLGVVRPVVSLDGLVASLGSKLTAGDGHIAQALVAGAVHDGDRRAVLNGAVVLGLVDRAAGDVDGSTLAGDVQAAGADLHAHGLGVDDAVFNVQRTAAGEVDAVAVRHIQRTVLQRNGIVGVVAVGLDAAVSGGRHHNILEHQTGVVVLDGTAHSRGDQTHQLAADDLAVLHGQRHVGVVDLERRAVCIRAGAGPGVAVQIHRAVNGARVER